MTVFFILGGAIWLAYTVVDIGEFSRKAELHWPALTWLIAAMIADVIIAASLGYSLVSSFHQVFQLALFADVMLEHLVLGEKENWNRSN